MSAEFSLRIVLFAVWLWVGLSLGGCSMRPQDGARPPAQVTPWAEFCKQWRKC